MCPRSFCSLCVSTLLCLHALNARAVFLCIFARQLHPYIHMYLCMLITERNRLRSALSFQVKIEAISELLTQLVVPSGCIAHCPVPSPSKQCSSSRLMSIPMTGDKENSEINTLHCPAPAHGGNGERRSSVLLRLLYIRLVPVPTTGAATAQAHLIRW